MDLIDEQLDVVIAYRGLSNTNDSNNKFTYQDSTMKITNLSQFSASPIKKTPI